MVKVITYGTYDMLHYGHVRLLERAKSWCLSLLRKNKAELFNKYADHNCERLTQVINQFLDSTRRK